MPRHRLQSWFSSLIFGIFVVGVYYAIRALVPETLALYDQAVTLLFIVVSALILFPARERIMARVLRRGEYFRFFGKDFHHLDFIARQFSVEDLVEEIFPTFMDWLGVRHARMAVLDPGRRSYRFHVYRNGRLLKSRFLYDRVNEELTRALKSRRATVYVTDPALSPALRQRMEDLGAIAVHPFLFRMRLLGFLVLHEPPRNKHADRALEFFGDKAGVSIQNHIYSYRVIDSRLYDLELSQAHKVQNILHNAAPPRIPGIEIRRQPQLRDFTSVIEFFQTLDGRCFIVVMSSERFTGAAGVVLYGIVGHLYSFIHRETNITLHRVLAHLKKHLAMRTEEYRVEVFAAEILPRDFTLVALIEGATYAIRDVANPSRPIASPGWRNFIELKPGAAIRIYYRERPLLDIRRDGPPPEETEDAARHSAGGVRKGAP